MPQPEGSFRAGLLELAQYQIEGMFSYYDQELPGDEEFLPLVELIIQAFAKVGLDKKAMKTLWQTVYDQYDKRCKEADPNSTYEENRDLMRDFLKDKKGIPL